MKTRLELLREQLLLADVIAHNEALRWRRLATDRVRDIGEYDVQWAQFFGGWDMSGKAPLVHHAYTKRPRWVSGRSRGCAAAGYVGFAGVGRYTGKLANMLAQSARARDFALEEMLVDAITKGTGAMWIGVDMGSLDGADAFHYAMIANTPTHNIYKGEGEFEIEPAQPKFKVGEEVRVAHVHDRAFVAEMQMRPGTPTYRRGFWYRFEFENRHKHTGPRRQGATWYPEQKVRPV
jgi:hypothetical protein